MCHVRTRPLAHHSVDIESPQPHLAYSTLSRYKTRLITNGSTQLLGIDVDETFSLVVKLATILTVLSLATSRQWPVHQLDVKNYFLHGNLSKTVYMHQPLGFWDSTHPDYQINDSLHQEFSMTDLGLLNYFLGISVACDSSGMFLSAQSKLGADGDLVSDLTLYRSLAGALQHLTFTRPNIFYEMKQVCLYMHDPREPHFSALDRILSDMMHAICAMVRAFLNQDRGVANVVAETFQHQRTKHIEIDIHFVRDLVAPDQLRVLHVPSRYQYADIFTNVLPSALFEESRFNLSVWCPPAQIVGEC
ncbi:ribonuclease H-like domain-containing protein [Tanacetum coccineum]